MVFISGRFDILHQKIDKDAKTGVLAGSLEDCIAMAKKTGAEALHPYIGGLVFELPEHMKGTCRCGHGMVKNRSLRMEDR